VENVHISINHIVVAIQYRKYTFLTGVLLATEQFINFCGLGTTNLGQN